MKKYRKKANQFVIAVKIDLDTNGFTYLKWDDVQRCKPGDWIVKNGDETYTIDAESFAKTYRCVGDGKYIKTSTIMADVAKADGRVRTKEGVSHFKKGDYIVCNEDGYDQYFIVKDKFEDMYELVDNDKSEEEIKALRAEVVKDSQRCSKWPL